MYVCGWVPDVSMGTLRSQKCLILQSWMYGRPSAACHLCWEQNSGPLQSTAKHILIQCVWLGTSRRNNTQKLRLWWRHEAPDWYLRKWLMEMVALGNQDESENSLRPWCLGEG